MLGGADNSNGELQSYITGANNSSLKGDGATSRAVYHLRDVSRRAGN